jgi:hypothetical protein
MHKITVLDTRTIKDIETPELVTEEGPRRNYGAWVGW